MIPPEVPCGKVWDLSTIRGASNVLPCSGLFRNSTESLKSKFHASQLKSRISFPDKYQLVGTATFCPSHDERLNRD